MEPARFSLDAKARVEQTRRDVVNADANASRMLEHLHRVIDHHAHRRSIRQIGTTCRDDDRRGLEDAPDEQRAPRRASSQVRCSTTRTPERHDDGPVRELVHAASKPCNLQNEVRVTGQGRDRGSIVTGDRFAEPRNHNRDETLLARRQRRRDHRLVCGSSDLLLREQRGELARNRCSVSRPRLAVLREHATDEVVESLRNLGSFAEPRRVLEENLREQRERVVALEDWRPGDALVEHTPEREDVGARIDVSYAARLLDGHVPGRANHQPGTRASSPDGSRVGDAKIEDSHVGDATARQEHVARLDVAMNDAACVRVAQRLRDVVAELQALPERQRCAVQPLPQVLTLKPFHRDERNGIDRHAVRHVPHDVGMLELAKDASLVLEASDIGRASSEHLQRDELTGHGVTRAVDGPHPAFAREALNLEATRGNRAWAETIHPPNECSAGSVDVLVYPRIQRLDNTGRKVSTTEVQSDAEEREGHDDRDQAYEEAAEARMFLRRGCGRWLAGFAQ